MTFREVHASDTAALTVSETVTAQVFQFSGLLWATECNAKAAEIDGGTNAQTVNAMNTLLMAYAALEALVLETALSIYPSLYAQSKFRRAGILAQYEAFLEADGRSGESLPAVIAEISRHRVALTHSEPDNVRSAVLGKVVSSTDAARYAKEVRTTAEWLWKSKRPQPIANAFDQPNCFL